MSNKGWSEPPNKVNRKGKLVAGRIEMLTENTGINILASGEIT